MEDKVTPPKIALSCVLAASASAACGQPADQDQTPTNSSASSGASTSAGDSGSTDTDASGGETGAGPRYDVNMGSDVPIPQLNGCEKIDFLFVIDNSESMDDESNAVDHKLPGFIDAIRSNVQGPGLPRHGGRHG